MCLRPFKSAKNLGPQTPQIVNPRITHPQITKQIEYVQHLRKVSKSNKLCKFESLRIYDLLYLFGNETGIEPGYSAELIFARIFFLSKFTCMPNFTSLKKVQVML
jgi:hypothetical protein